SAEVGVLFFEQVDFAGIVVERAREGAAETGDVHASVDGVDAVGKGVFGRGPAIVVLDRQFDLHTVHFADGADRAGLHFAAIFVEVAHEGDKATLEVEGCFAISALIEEADGETSVEVGHLTETLGENVEIEVTSFHDGEVRYERGDGACPFGWLDNL